jgi:hypothetical protein
MDTGRAEWRKSRDQLPLGRQINFQLPTSNFQLPTSNFQLPTSNSQLAAGSSNNPAKVDSHRHIAALSTHPSEPSAASWELEVGSWELPAPGPGLPGAGACYHLAPMARRTPDSDLRRYAVVGAEQRLLQIAEEAANIFRAFPELRDSGFMQRSAAERGGRGDSVAPRQPRRRSRMSAAARKAVSVRMKKYWAGRRKQR